MKQVNAEGEGSGMMVVSHIKLFSEIPLTNGEGDGIISQALDDANYWYLEG